MRPADVLRPRTRVARAPVERALAARIIAARVLAATALVAGAGCGGVDAEREPASGPAPSTLEMAARLARIEDESDFSDELRELDTARIAPTLQASLIHGARRSYYLLQAGRSREAGAELSRLSGIASRRASGVPADYRDDVWDMLALAAVWGAIEEVCLADAEGCLFPLAPERFGPAYEPQLRAAVELYRTLLEGTTDDIVRRWLLNLAYMALGEHPEGVPPELLLEPSTMTSEADIGRFPERGAELGVDVPGHAGGVALEDFDGDGDLDLLVSSRFLRDSMRYFENREGVFVDRSEAAGVAPLIGGLNLLQADYDNDGDVDVFVLRGAWTAEGQPNSLLRNEGDGRFTDVTEAAGVLSVHPTQTAAWGDYDNDGWLDLIVGNEAEMRARPPRAHATELYRNNGDGTFTDVAEEAGLTILGFVKAVVWGDYDNDGRLDLYVSLYEEPNRLYRNEGPGADGVWRFTDVTERAGVAEPLASLPAWWFDVDHDGWLDIFVSSFRVKNDEVIRGLLGETAGAETPRIYRNRGDGTFEDATRRLGMDRVVYTMGSNYGDLDNDGWLDLYLGTGDPDLRTIVPNFMFRNDGGRAFQDISVSGGFSHMAKGHAVAFGDIDNDGDQDLYVVLGGAIEGDVGRNALWENPGHGGRWITLRLEGVEANRSAIGARIRVSLETPSGPREVHALAGTGGSFGGSSLQQEIGLGDALAIREVEVRWPGSGRVDRLTGLELDAVYELREGDAPRRVEPALLRLGGARP